MSKNVILLSIDALRPDRLGCGGYHDINTPNIDEIAAHGTIYDRCITASCLTPVSMSSVMTAKYPSKHGLRNPFGQISAVTVAELFKNKGYATAGYTGINFLSRRCGFHKGFDVWDEPTDETGWFQKKYKTQDGAGEMTTNWGNWWPPKMMEFIQQNQDKPFFVWGHYFEVHFHAEKWMLQQGMLEEGVLSDNAYYDAKVKYLDEHVIGPLNQYLKDNGLWEKTMMIFMSDHGETMMHNPGLALKDMGEDYPKHRTMSQSDLTSTLIMTHVRQPGSRDKNLVRTIDVVPTILDVCFGEGIWDADGQSLRNNYLSQPAYSEELFEKRGAGALQAVQNNRFKFIRNNTTHTEELYDLREDPNEKNNIVSEPSSQGNNRVCRELLNKHLTNPGQSAFAPEDEAIVLQKLKELGYI